MKNGDGFVAQNLSFSHIFPPKKLMNFSDSDIAGVTEPVTERMTSPLMGFRVRPLARLGGKVMESDIRTTTKWVGNPYGTLLMDCDSPAS